MNQHSPHLPSGKQSSASSSQQQLPAVAVTPEGAEPASKVGMDTVSSAEAATTATTNQPRRPLFSDVRRVSLESSVESASSPTHESQKQQQEKKKDAPPSDDDTGASSKKHQTDDDDDSTTTAAAAAARERYAAATTLASMITTSSTTATTENGPDHHQRQPAPEVTQPVQRPSSSTSTSLQPNSDGSLVRQVSQQPPPPPYTIAAGPQQQHPYPPYYYFYPPPPPFYASSPYYPAPPPPLSMHLADPSQQQQRKFPLPQQQHLYMVLTVERCQVKDPWGLSISLMDDTFLVLGQVVPNCQSLVREYWAATTVKPAPSFFWTKPAAYVHNVAESIRVLLEERPPVMASNMRLPAAQVLQPGDCIVAMGGRPVSEFDTLGAITNFLRGCETKQLQFLIYRNTAALQQAAAAAAAVPATTPSSENTNTNNNDKVTQQSAALNAATQVFRSLFKVPASKSRSTATTSASSCMYTVNKHPLLPSEATYLSRYSYVFPKNKLFVDPATGKRGIPYADQEFEYDPDDDRRSSIFLPRIENFAVWLCQRKQAWRKTYTVSEITENWVQEEKKERNISASSSECFADRHDSSVAVDFWSAQGYSSFDRWLAARTAQWKPNYSWNRRKRKRLEQDCEEVVHLAANSDAVDQTSFDNWLRVRKNQWKILRRKRQRQLLQNQKATTSTTDSAAAHDDSLGSSSDGDQKSKDSCNSVQCTLKADLTATKPTPCQDSHELLAIDALLEEQEKERLALETRPPLDISFLFSVDLCPDDVVAKIFRYLPPLEHGKMLCIDRKSRQGLMKRQRTWQQLCPSHWNLPRRPRKPWHELYRTRLRVETEQFRKRCDDLLSRATSILERGDQLQAMEKLVNRAERECGFHVDYISGVVCERNSLINLAVIHERHKIVKWLVETKHADIESHDRGHFTPLINAAWAGDRVLVRFLLQHGADRSKVGTCHYTRPLAHPEFEGLTAYGWAKKRGHDGIAKLLLLGLDR